MEEEATTDPDHSAEAENESVTVGGELTVEETIVEKSLEAPSTIKESEDTGVPFLSTVPDEKSSGEGSDKVLLQRVTVLPKLVYGIRTDVIGNVHFNLSNEVIYPVEGVLAFHDFVRNKQRFLRMPEFTVPEIIAIAHHRKLLAMLERSNNVKLNIAIYDLIAMKKRRILDLPASAQNAQIVQLLFTQDGKSIVFLTKSPEEMLYLIFLDRHLTTYEGYPAPTVALRGSINCICCHPTDNGMVAACGKNVVVFWNKAEKNFVMGTNTRLEINAISICFIFPEVVLLGTDDDQLVLVENGDLKLEMVASEVELFDITWDQEAYERVRIEPRSTYDPDDADKYMRVTLLTSFNRGFCFAIFNKVFVFEKITKFKYEKKLVLLLPPDLYPEPLYQITSLALDHKYETIVVTAKHSQIYVGTLILPETLRTKQLKLTPLGPLIHIAKDQTIRIWNYETEEIELIRKFQVDITLVELSPTGLMAAVGFSDQLRLTQIFMDELNIVKTYNFPHCRAVKYSNMGHLMAAAYSTHISITSVYTLDILITLIGHNGNVLDIAFSKDDTTLVSGGAEGAIYEWDVVTGERRQEIVQKGTEYLSICVAGSKPMSIYAATQYGTIREFQHSDLVREVTMPSRAKCKLTSVCLSRSDLIMYVSDELGGLFNVQLPFLEAGGGTCTRFRFFTSKITKLRFTYCGTLLLMSSANGTLVIGALDNLEGRVLSHDADLLKSTEILIPRALLHEKIEQIKNLEIRLKQQTEEFQYQMSQNEIFDVQQMAEIHKTYCNALEELKKKNNEMEERHVEDMNQVTFEISDLKADQHKQLEILNEHYSETMLIEYQKFSNLRQTMIELRASYEEKLKRSAGTLQDTVEALENDYKRQLDERKELIRELMKEMQDKNSEFVEYCKQVESETGRGMVGTQLSYENKLTAERNESQLWRGKAGVLQQKFDNMSRDVENLLEEVETLKEEHNKNHKNITKLNRNIEELQKDIADRDFAINSKEKRIIELLHKNQELEKYKQVLSHKIDELKALIEPKEHQINDKRKRIMEMERELDGLNEHNQGLEIQLKEMKQKYVSNMADLKAERRRAIAGRECIQNICSDIYSVAGNINSTQGLKKAVREMFNKHASDEELRRFISLDAQVREEFQRQRAEIERVLHAMRNREEDNDDKRKYDKLFQENVGLLKEIEKLGAENGNLRARLKRELKDNYRKLKKSGTIGDSLK